jgi:predicted RNase H-like nuclease
MKGGWVAVVLEDGRFLRDELLTPVETGFAELDDAAVIGIDVPIGFGPREADAIARAYVSHASTVFSTPPRAVLERPFGPGLGVSAQAHALGPRIIHVTELARHDERIHEVHPEASFRAMNDGEPLPKKRSADGALKRIELLRRHGIDLELPSPTHDVLDAAAAAWSAHRIAQGEAQCLGYAIWY